MTRQSKWNHKATSYPSFGSLAAICTALGFEKGRGPVFNYEDTDAVIFHSKLAAAVIDTMLSMQEAMSASRLRTCWSAHRPLSNPSQPEQVHRIQANMNVLLHVCWMLMCRSVLCSGALAPWDSITCMYVLAHQMSLLIHWQGKLVNQLWQRTHGHIHSYKCQMKEGI